MNTIQSGQMQELVIKKSKFLSIALNVNSPIHCDVVLNKLRQEFNDCSHITYAYCIGSLEHCSDDGEPSGTAGKPILNVIKQKKLTNVLIVVIRYFGGIKLGAGGLIRAYTESAVKAIDSVEIVEIKHKKIISFHINYEQAFKIYILSNFGDFQIVERVGNDFVIECDLENYEKVLTDIKKFDVSNIKEKDILK